MKLYGYFRSSASYRVRIALSLKGLDMARYPTLARVHDNCMRLPAFADQAPERQPDAE